MGNIVTLQDLKDTIVELIPEIEILELLNIDATDLVNRFEDKILNNFDKLVEYIEGGNGDQDYLIFDGEEEDGSSTYD